MLSGERRVTIDGREYRLVFDINAMADFEGVTGKTAFDALEALDKQEIGTSDMRALFWSCFQEHHPEIGLRDAGRLLSRAPTALGTVVQAAMPDTAGDDSGNSTAAVKKP